MDVAAEAPIEVELAEMVRDLDNGAEGFLRGARRAGAQVLTGQPVEALDHAAGLWRVKTPGAEFVAPIVVNAAGAWADRVGALAGAGGDGDLVGAGELELDFVCVDERHHCR